MNQEVNNAIKKHSMLKNCNGIVIGLSGGADSIALLLVLEEICKQKNIKLYAAHINHMLRGQEAFRDEQFVKDLCDKKGIELFCLKADISKIAKQNKEGIEQCGRRVRYDFFNEVLEKTKAQKIATAHTASDNIETMLFNFTRGTGIKGMCGILPVRDNIIRPLINCSREDIENYCKSKGQDYIIDSSNFCLDYSRNKIRNTVIPILKEINPCLITASKKLSNSAIEDEKFLYNLAKKALYDADFDGNSFKKNVLLLQEDSISIRAIKLACQMALGISLDYDKSIAIKDLLKKNTSKKVQIKGYYFAYISYERLFFKKINKDIDNNFEVFLNFSDNYLPNGSIITINDNKINNLETNYSLDYDKIKGKLRVRTKKEGDYFCPKDKQGGKSLKKLLIDKKIPLEKRKNILVVLDETGIVFVEGIGVSKNKVAQKGKREIAINIRRENNNA